MIFVPKIVPRLARLWLQFVRKRLEMLQRIFFYFWLALKSIFVSILRLQIQFVFSVSNGN